MRFATKRCLKLRKQKNHETTYDTPVNFVSIKLLRSCAWKHSLNYSMRMSNLYKKILRNVQCEVCNKKITRKEHFKIHTHNSHELECYLNNKTKNKTFVSTNCFRRIIGGLKNNVIYLSDLLEMWLSWKLHHFSLTWRR